MKSKKIIYMCFLLPFLFGCSGYLDQVPNDRQTIEQVFAKKLPSEQYLANVYTYVPDLTAIQSSVPWTANVDELEVTWQKYDPFKLNSGNWNASNAPFATWGNYYKGIRSATYFINHIDGNPEILQLSGQELIDQYKAEARFLRAYFYFLLMQQYGPVVIVGDKELAVDAPTSSLQIARSPYDSCVAYVVKELDAVAPTLLTKEEEVLSEKDQGRATLGAALALKARLLLYAASPEYNGNTDFANFKNQDGTPLISQVYDKEKWKKAADAAKAVIDLNSYQLYADPSGDAVKSYRDVLLKAWNDEGIFVRKSNGLNSYDIHCSLRSAGGWNGLCPTQEMVDAYFMSDGKSISESSLYSESGFTGGIYNMYINREPRFYASIQYNGMMYKGGNITTSTAIQMNYSGKDGKKSGGDDYSKTGYLLYKNLSPATNRITNVNNSRPYVLFRLGEIYLNYAEALAEYGGNDAEALNYLNLIRKRAGIPQYGAGTLPTPSGSDFIQKIHAERRVELAFECHRWFDVRRWKIADKVMGNMHGMDVNGDGNAFYNRVVVSNHLWNSAYYWWPIEQYEMDRSSKIVQNPGW